MGCQLYTTPGSYTWTWPDGVDRAVAGAQGGSGGGVNGVGSGGRGAGGGGAFAERLILKTDATATVVVGSGGVHGVTNATDGVASGVTQASSVVEKVTAAGGKGGAGPAGGAGGTTAASYGTILYKGGDGASRNGDSGGGGGATACADGPGDDGDQGDGTNNGPGGDVCGGTVGAGGGGGDGGGDGENGQNGPAGGGGGGGTDGVGGDGAGGFVSICWTDPTPDGYCVDSGTCNKWWPACGQVGYGGPQCFYYGYGYLVGHELACCLGTIQPGTLYFTHNGDGSIPAQTVQMHASPIIVEDGPTYISEALVDHMSRTFYAWIFQRDDGCLVAFKASNTNFSLDFPNPSDGTAPWYAAGGGALLSCSPFYMTGQIRESTTLTNRGTFEITE